MSEFKRAQTETRSVEIKAFKPRSFSGMEEVPYTEIKKEFGSLALTDGDSNPSFRLNTSSKKSLGIEAEERSQLEGMVREEVEARINRIKETAHKEGFDEGKRQGNIDARAEFALAMNPLMKQFETLMSGLDQTRAELFKANEKVLIELIYQMNKRLLIKEVTKDNEYILRLLRDLMERVGVKENIRILIGKADFENLEKIKEFLKIEFPELKNIQFDVSEELSHGGCLVETDLSRVDASVDTQLKLILDALGAQ